MSFSFLSQKNGRTKIGFIGVGRSTIGVYQYLRSLGFQNFCFRSERPATLPAFVQAKLICAENYLSDMTEDVLFLSPSVKLDKAEFAGAKARGCLFSSDCDLFFREAVGDIYAVTGSDGKSTTTTMLFSLLKSARENVRIGGNIGMALCPYLCDNRRDAQYAVELSSFQLVDLKPHAKRAVITTISPNHLDFHGSFLEYTEAKKHIYENVQEPVLNADCPFCQAALGGRPFAVFSLWQSKSELQKFGAEILLYRENEKIFLNDEEIFTVADMKIPGLFNVANLMCATALGYGAFDLSYVKEFAKSFEGISHRAQTVAEIGGVKYVDSSIDSSPARTVATLSAFSSETIVILGGKGKGVPLDSLTRPLTEKAKGVIVMGETGEEIYALLSRCDAFQKSGTPLIQVHSMAEAVGAASSLAKPGDTVLLSPASTSFDAYRNFEERGEDFREEVNKLTKGC